MAVFAVVHKTGFQRGVYAGDDGLVDVALALFAPFDFDFVVEELCPSTMARRRSSGCVALMSIRFMMRFPFSFS